jgi:hypothetical protein
MCRQQIPLHGLPRVAGFPMLHGTLVKTVWEEVEMDVEVGGRNELLLRSSRD